MQITPYIIFNGNCEEALKFYAKAFGGEIKNLSYYEGSPAESMSPGKGQVLHANFEAKGLSLMASDSGKGAAEEQAAGMVHLSVNFDDTATEEKVFRSLGEGANITMPLQDTFWGARFGMLTDKYGVKWMFNCENKTNE